MKTQKEILRWLKLNGLPLGGLTNHDTHALIASVALTPLISHAGAPHELFYAYQRIVLEMQDTTRHLAFHAIACELDWGHRAMIWHMARLGNPPASKCLAEPGQVDKGTGA